MQLRLVVFPLSCQQNQGNVESNIQLLKFQKKMLNLTYLKISRNSYRSSYEFIWIHTWYSKNIYETSKKNRSRSPPEAKQLLAEESVALGDAWDDGKIHRSNVPIVPWEFIKKKGSFCEKNLPFKHIWKTILCVNFFWKTKPKRLDLFLTGDLEPLLICDIKKRCWRGTWHFRALPREEQSVEHVYSPEVASGHCLYRAHYMTNPKQCSIFFWEITQNHHTFAVLDPPKPGNFMTPCCEHQHQQPNKDLHGFATRWPSHTWSASHRDIDTHLSCRSLK